MGVKSYIARRWAARRLRAIRREGLQPQASQARTLRELLSRASATEFGRAHGFASIDSAAQFRQAVPVRDYEAARPFFEKIKSGGVNVTWPGQPLYLAKTSGTTSGAKYIPLTREALRSQLSGARDALFWLIHRSGQASFLNGKMIFLSGSPELETNEAGLKVGRLSGIVNHAIPAYLKANRLPSWEVNCIADWDQKLDRIVAEAVQQDLRLLSGIPPWMQQFFERVQAHTGKSPRQVWPRLNVIIHGGVNFAPYEPVFRQWIDDSVHLAEVFPASEGFFAVQDGISGEGMRLNLNNGVFYEFIPLAEYGKPNAQRLTVSEVERNQAYAMVVSTNAGLWAYDLGDVVRFTSVVPPRIVVTGRVKHFISAFGEHVIGEEVEAAMNTACMATGAVVNEFTVAPLVSEQQGSSRHQWWAEFQRPPSDVQVFAQLLDEAVASRNAYYRDLRSGGTLAMAELILLQPGACNEYMRAQGRLGGQSKFPRLQNNREVVEQLERMKMIFD